MPFDLAAVLAQKKADGLYRRRRTLSSAQGARVVVDGRELLNFCSNDYLGLANHPEVVAAFQQAAARYGVGSGASHLVCGHSAEHEALEADLAAFTGRERALLFSTGYMANTGIVQALVGRGDAVFEDRLNHASLIDGGLASGAQFQRYRHNDVAHLAELLAKSSADKKLIVTDGVFSMDGDLAPLVELAALARAHDAWLMVDDAHGLGVLGGQGGGAAEHFGLSARDLPVLMGTLGKGAGAFGAFVAGDDVLVDYLINTARPYIYTTALPPAVAAASRASLVLLRDGQALRDRLRELILLFRDGARSLGLDLMPSTTPIQPLLLGGNERALAWSAALEQKGCLVGAIRPPTVPAGQARLRITFTAAHQRADVDHLLQALADCRGMTA
ncbi:MAG: 8-amino-7-oxononanoate synthase [Moraxellaceae bacterium]|jgi:8-amino-7-oxononanoate synthase|nr:8-amino-7-oxononanoate synthase [Moraxellaceae bacterium]